MRAKLVSLTPKGRNKFEQLSAASASIRESMSSALSEKEYRVLVELLEKVTESLKSQTTTFISQHQT